jgi:outer membrane immunogenic protein
MKALLSALAIGILASGSAHAADLSLPVTKGPIAFAAFDWSGVYIGGHIGGGWEKSTFIDPGASQIFANCCVGNGLAGGAAATDSNPSSFLGGVQAGWMYQIGRLVVGTDIDWSWTSLNGSGVGNYPPVAAAPGFFASEAYGVSTKWTGTATTVIGIARDRWMLYSKLGAAWAHHEYSLNITGSNGAAFGFGPPSVSDTRIGWTVGTGVKWALTNSWFLNVEYDYMDFGSKAQNFSAVCAGACAANPSTFNPTFNDRISEVKVGLNYKFPSGFFLFW